MVRYSELNVWKEELVIVVLEMHRFYERFPPDSDI